jgi:hypothetical protein
VERRLYRHILEIPVEDNRKEEEGRVEGEVDRLSYESPKCTRGGRRINARKGRTTDRGCGDYCIIFLSLLISRTYYPSRSILESSMFWYDSYTSNLLASELQSPSILSPPNLKPYISYPFSPNHTYNSNQLSPSSPSPTHFPRLLPPHTQAASHPLTPSSSAVSAAQPQTPKPPSRRHQRRH